MKKHRIVLLSGKQGSGKTTMALRLLELAKAQGFVPKRLRFADPLYEMHNAMLPIAKKYGLVPQDCDKEGALLQLIGTEWGRKTRGENCWVEIVRRQIDSMLAFATTVDDRLFITIEDARFPNEFDFFPDAYRVRLEASEETRKLRTHSWRENTEHPSETGLDDYANRDQFDLRISTMAAHPDWVAHRLMRGALAHAQAHDE